MPHMDLNYAKNCRVPTPTRKPGKWDNIFQPGIFEHTGKGNFTHNTGKLGEF